MKVNEVKSDADVNQVTGAENTHKTMRWIQSTMGELRNEMVELSRSVNVSQQLQKQQESASQLELVRSDVAALQVAAVDDAAQRTRLNQTVQQVTDELTRLDHHHQVANQHLQRIENDVSSTISHIHFY